MIRLGLRLTLQGGREASTRMLVTATAVALGVGLLLLAVAGVNGLHAQTVRGAWLNTSPLTAPSAPSGSRTGRLWWLLRVDQFGQQAIDRVDVAASGPNPPVPPGIPHLPAVGEYYASPALTSLLESTPASELGDRFPGRQIGTIGAAALPSPNSLIVVVGHSARQLARVPGAVEVRGIQETPSDCFTCRSGGGSARLLQWILAGGAVALLLPVLVLIATASRLSAARREERFAAMRLVGATLRQVSVMAAVEATVSALAGVVVGFALFFLFRPLVTRVPFTGAPLAPGDLSLGWVDAVLVVAGVPIAAVVFARLGLRRLRLSPLGVARRRPSVPPRVLRTVPLGAGVAVLAYFDAAGKPKSNGGQVLELLGGLVLLVGGLVLAGPWLTKAGSRLMAHRANRPATLIAGRRLLDDPRAAFRSISGLVLALFVTSAAVGALTSIAAARATGRTAGSTGTLAQQFCGVVRSCHAGTDIPSVPARVLAGLRSTPAVRAVTVVHVSPTPHQQTSGAGVVACDALAKTPAIGMCPPGAAVAQVGVILGDNEAAKPVSSTVWPSAALSVPSIATLPVEAVVVATNGPSTSLERARTSLERAFALRGPPVLVDGISPQEGRLWTMVQDMTDVVVVASLIIAACSLAVNVAAGLSERRRPFSLLRLTGVPTGVLHRVVALENALPLVVVSVVSIAVGLVAAALFLRSQLDFSLRVPGIAYWAAVAGGMVASLAIITATFPLLDRITGPDVARNE